MLCCSRQRFLCSCAASRPKAIPFWDGQQWQCQLWYEPSVSDDCCRVHEFASVCLEVQHGADVPDTPTARTVDTTSPAPVTWRGRLRFHRRQHVARGTPAVSLSARLSCTAGQRGRTRWTRLLYVRDYGGRQNRGMASLGKG